MMAKRNYPKVEGRKALSLRQAAERIGVCHKTLRTWVEQGQGPPCIVIEGPRRNTYRIQQAALERWINANTRNKERRR